MNSSTFCICDIRNSSAPPTYKFPLSMEYSFQLSLFFFYEDSWFVRFIYVKRFEICFGLILGVLIALEILPPIKLCSDSGLIAQCLADREL
jgi:hypothetical protein